MRIQHNIMAMNAYRNMGKNNSALSKNLEKLSSGYRINRAGDDAAGLAISEKMRAQIAGLDQAQKNAQSGINLVQTAEGALTEVHDMLNRMVTLSTQAANGTYSETDRAKIQSEINALSDEIDRIADNSNFNGTKLLDGSLDISTLTEQDIAFNSASSTAGVTINEATNGGGTKGSVTIDLSQAFTEGDTIEFKFLDNTGTAVTPSPTGEFTFTMKNNPSAGQEFGGTTIEEQAKSLADKLSVHGKIGTNFDITVDGSKVTLTSKTEGTNAPLKVDSVEVDDADVVTTANATPAVTAGVAYADGTAATQKFELLGGSNTALAVEAGDKLTFKFKDANGVDLEVDLEVTETMKDTNAEKMTNNILAALKDKTFKDNADTVGVDESQLKVSDIFALTQTTAGTINVAGPKAVGADGYGSAVNVTVDRAGTKNVVNATGAAATKATDAGGTASTVKLDDANMAQNFSVGDKFTLEGKLRDGSTFKVELVAGKDFEVGDTKQGTLDNIAAALQSDKVAVQVTSRDGKSTKTLTGADLFSATGATGADKREFTVAGGTDLTVTSADKGTATSFSASEITKMTVTPMENAAVTLTKDLAVAQSAAQSSFAVDENLQYGAAIKVGDTTYEIVADARDTSNRNNTAIVVSDLTDSNAIAQQLAEAIQKDQADYTVTANGNKVEMSTKAIGSDQVALEVTAPYGDEVTTASFKFDTDAVKEGSVMEFNGNKYEFVKAGNKPENNGAIAVEVADFDKATAKDLANAFADVAKNGLATVGEDGTVTLKSFEGEDGSVAKPEISFGQDLTLQIGADAVETIGVQIASMKADDLGIKNLDISDPELANKAIEKVKAAIEQVSVQRGNLGAVQNRLEHTINNLGVMEENIQDAEANIRDTDIADEMMAYTKNNILIQSAQAMLAQANQAPQGVLQLMG